MQYKDLIYEKDGRIVRLILNRPDKLNALGASLLAELKSALERAEEDEDARVIIIKGAGRAFSAGYDLTPAPSGHQPAKLSPHLARKHHVRRNQDVWFTIWNLAKPVIAQVHGYCLAGGSELAFMCDITIMAEDALTGYPPVRNLSTPDTVFHPWLAGMKQAKLMLFTGDSITGKRAAEIGMATMAVPADRLEEETNKLAERIALIPTDLVSLSKVAVNHSYDLMGFRTAIEHAGVIHDHAHSMPSTQEFKRMTQEKGLKAALDHRDTKFGDLRTTDEARKRREEGSSQ